ncbi:hypothetical protein POJ06DRAFT_254343 [Lipomyces tetrasporus]|uniref:Uncharacterized protein n=1 Tax=Lipomyces tetrasporus TaxID=54092 RepID=A0AAD7QR39_9ASCO|nr:uncharacterized protein POJ06DRAFT_254343 [Lipomyces tetrasporus]KAJ8099735.1 hypothetical protein POJ06DRAFT_254343 [Lipomyces tetrasporus]
MATNDVSNSSDQLAAPLMQRPVASTPPLSTESVSSSGLPTPVSASSAGDVVDDADLSDSPTEPSTAGSATSQNVPSRPESRSSTLSGISTTAVKDGVEGRRVHHRSAEFKPSLVAAHHHHRSHQPNANLQPPPGSDHVQSQSSTDSNSYRPTSRTPTISSTSSSDIDDMDRSLPDLSAGSKPLYDDYEEYTSRLANE